MSFSSGKYRPFLPQIRTKTDNGSVEFKVKKSVPATAAAAATPDSKQDGVAEQQQQQQTTTNHQALNETILNVTKAPKPPKVLEFGSSKADNKKRAEAAADHEQETNVRTILLGTGDGAASTAAEKPSKSEKETAAAAEEEESKPKASSSYVKLTYKPSGEDISVSRRRPSGYRTLSGDSSSGHNVTATNHGNNVVVGVKRGSPTSHEVSSTTDKMPEGGGPNEYHQVRF